jgi:hypothetical protein
MSGPESGPERRIIIDEDWKQKVEAEREAIRRQQMQKGEEEGEKPSAQARFPEATFDYLLNMLATQALLSLGVLPNPLTGRHEVNLAQAKLFIDLLGVLEEKTQGNRTPEETAMLQGMLDELRLAFVQVHDAIVAQLGPDFGKNPRPGGAPPGPSSNVGR